MDEWLSLLHYWGPPTVYKEFAAISHQIECHQLDYARPATPNRRCRNLNCRETLRHLNKLVLNRRRRAERKKLRVVGCWAERYRFGVHYATTMENLTTDLGGNITMSTVCLKKLQMNYKTQSILFEGGAAVTAWIPIHSVSEKCGSRSPEVFL